MHYYYAEQGLGIMMSKIYKEIMALRVGTVPQKCNVRNHGNCPKILLFFLFFVLFVLFFFLKFKNTSA